MSKITSVEIDGVEGKRKLKVVYSKNIENEMLLMTTCLCKDDLGTPSISRSMCSKTDDLLIENSSVIDEAFLLTLADKESTAKEINYVFYCYLNNIRFIYIPFTYTDKYITLISDQKVYGIQIPSEVGFNKNTEKLSDIPSIAGYIFVTETDEPLDNFGYGIHEIIDNPHRNLKESVLYCSESDDYKHQDFFLSENGYIKDKRSKAFIAENFEEL